MGEERMAPFWAHMTSAVDNISAELDVGLRFLKICCLFPGFGTKCINGKK